MKFWLRVTKERTKRIWYQVREFNESYPYPPPADTTTSNWLYGEWMLVQEIPQP